MNKKAQSASSAAAFIAILTVLIILYILFLPPDIRQELLSDSGSGTGTGGTGSSGTSISTNTLFTQTIGHVSYINTNEKLFDIPTVRIYSPTEAQVIKSISSIYIKNALFDKEKATYEFNFDIEKSATENVVLSFNVKDHYGPISITLNNKTIFSGEITSNNPKPISLDKNDLQDSNTIKFSVQNPGVMFWKSNTYTIENLQVTGDVTDYSNSAAVQYFSLTQAERENLDTVTLYFRPVCTISNVGPLEIDLNRRVIFNSVADCGTRSFAILDKNMILQGSNELRFSTNKGSYLLDNLDVKVTLTKPAYNTYFFDMNSDYFKSVQETATCGDYDGICSPGCDDTRDADCCFRHNGFWCALPTTNLNDRCVFYVAPEDCKLCMTGYYDDSGDVPKNCEGLCGDNKDNKCPSDCPSPAKYYDQDCCYDNNSDNFWCQEVPIIGLPNKCTTSVRYSECSLCHSGYEDDSGDNPDTCDTRNYQYAEVTQDLLSNYDIKLTVRFTDDTKRKRVELNVNGHAISIDTIKIEYTRLLDDYVREGTNSIEIVPKEDIDIAEIKVDALRVS
jgi:hypothetical protein